MKTVGIKLADGSFYPIMEEGSVQIKTLDLTTTAEGQPSVKVDLYRSQSCSMDDAEYIDTLGFDNLTLRADGEPSVSFCVAVDENNQLTANIIGDDDGKNDVSISLLSRSEEEREQADSYEISASSKTVRYVAAGVVLGAGLLKTADGLLKTENNKIKVPLQTKQDTFKGEDFIVAEKNIDSFEADDFSLDDISENDFEPSDFNLDSFDDTSLSDESVSETTKSDLASSLPDIDFSAGSTDFSSDSTDFLADTDSDTGFDEGFSLDDLTTDSSEAYGISKSIPSFDDDFSSGDSDLTDFDNASLSDAETDSLFADDNSDLDSFSSDSTFNFSGLYDKETEMGDSSSYDEEDSKKRTRIPVVICIICAVICLLATAAILFLGPLKTLFSKKSSEKSALPAVAAIEKADEIPEPQQNQMLSVVEAEVQDLLPEEPEQSSEITEDFSDFETELPPVPESYAPLAKEDEIVIIEEAEKVEPLPPPVVETKPEPVRYKVKWGDTLWDIANTYYKNPWKYTYIARYNGIKNPDRIVSGTIITIPAE